MCRRIGRVEANKAALQPDTSAWALGWPNHNFYHMRQTMALQLLSSPAAMIVTIRYFYYLTAPKLGRMALSFDGRSCQEQAVLL